MFRGVVKNIKAEVLYAVQHIACLVIFLDLEINL